MQAVAQMKKGRVVDLDESVPLKAPLVILKHKWSMADTFVYPDLWGNSLDEG